MNLQIELQPKQRHLLELVRGGKYSVIMYGGSAGGAKSHGIRDVSLILSCKHPGLRVLIIRRVSTELLSNHIQPFFQKYGELREYFNKTERTIYYPNGSITKFGSADNEDDIYSYQGDEYDLIFIDEATHFTQKMIEFLMTRNRGQKSGFKKPKTVMTMNPGGVGHSYIKRLGIDRMFMENEDPEDYVYLPAKIYDNAYWSLNALEEMGFTAKDYYSWTDEQRLEFCYKHSDYAKKLLRLPPNLRRAYLEGDWNLSDKMFFNKFRASIHIIKPFEIPEDWRRMAGMDYGNTTCAHLAAMNPDRNLFVTHEWTEIKKTVTERARSYRNFLDKIGLYGIKTMADTNMFASKCEDDVKKTPAEVFKEHGVMLTEVVKARGPENKKFRVWCNDLVQDILNWETDSNGLYTLKPKLYFFEGRCPNLVKTLQELQVDEDEPEDIERDQDIDHWYDSLKYCLINIKKPEDPEYRQKLKKLYEKRRRSVV